MINNDALWTYGSVHEIEIIYHAQIRQGVSGVGLEKKTNPKKKNTRKSFENDFLGQNRVI